MCRHKGIEKEEIQTNFSPSVQTIAKALEVAVEKDTSALVPTMRPESSLFEVLLAIAVDFIQSFSSFSATFEDLNLPLVILTFVPSGVS